MSDEQIIEALATKVMLWTKQGQFPNDFWVDSEGNTQCSVGLWEPLTEPEDSKLVREKLAGYYWKLEHNFEGFKFTIWTKDNRGDLIAEADTEERAAAKAALLAVGIDATFSPQ